MKKIIMGLCCCLTLIISSQVSAVTFITIGTGSTTGIYYPVGVGLAKLLNEADIDIRANARATGASVYNALALEKGDLQLAILQNDVAYYAYNSATIEAFEGKPQTKLRSLAVLYPEVVQIIAKADAGIDSIADLRGRQVYIGDIGSGATVSALQILAAYDISENDIQAIRGSANSATDDLQNGRIDAMFYTVGIGNAAITQVTETTNVKLLPIEPDIAADIQADYPFYDTTVIPANTYRGLDEDINALSVPAILAASSDVDDDTIDAIVTTILDNLDEFKSFHSTLEQYFDTPQENGGYDAIQETSGGAIPLHEGASIAYARRLNADNDSTLEQEDQIASEAG